MRGWAAVCLIAGLGAAGCLRADAGPPTKVYQITGVVVSARDGSPVPYCRITANAAPSSVIPPARPASTPQQASKVAAAPGLRPAGVPNTPPEVTADAQGRFSLTVPRAGNWRLAGMARGFRGQSYEEHDGFYEAVVLTEAAPVYNVTFRLTPNSVLRGLVFDEAGEPVAQAQVMAELVPELVPGQPAAEMRPRNSGFGQTDDLGRYEIAGLAPGQYRLRVQAQPWYTNGGRGAMGMIVRLNPGGTQANAAPPDPSLDVIYPVTWFPGVDDASAAEPITLGPGEERQADFHLTALPSVHLKIPRTDTPEQNAQNGQNGQQRRPIPQRPVSVTRIGGDQGMGYQQNASGGFNGGEWDFGGLSPGTYEVRIPSADGKSFDVKQIEVRAGSQTELTMEGAKPLVKVEVKVDGPDGDRAQVEFVDTETGARIASQPNMRGRGGFPGGGIQGDFQGGLADDQAEQPEESSRSVSLAPHEYEVYVNGAGGVYLTGLTAAGAKVSGRTVTIVGAATVTLHLANKHAQLEGVARLEGAPAAGAMVLLVPATLGKAGDLTEIKRDETNTDGGFLMSGIVPGQYIVVAIDRGWNVDWRNPATLGQYLLHGTPVDLRTAARAREELQAAAP